LEMSATQAKSKTKMRIIKLRRSFSGRHCWSGQVWCWFIVSEEKTTIERQCKAVIF